MINRRQFVQSSGAALAGAFGAGRLPRTTRAAPRGANDDIRVAVVGVNGFGRSHIRAYRALPGVRLVALCDVDEQVLSREAGALARDGVRVLKYRDLRKLLDNPEIDVISVATPNHWHALATVWACQAGKDVCVEAPVSHSIWEGRQMIEAARKYDRIVQVALEHRCQSPLADAYEFVRSGEIGKVAYARVIDYERRTSLGKVVGPQQVPPHVDFNLWTGPAPLRPLLREFLHFDWHWQWDTGGGEITCNGTRLLDEVRWALGKPHPPRGVLAFGGRYGYIDDGQTPNTLVAVFDYDGIPVVYEARGLSESRKSENMDSARGETANNKPLFAPHDSPYPNVGCMIFCEGGYCRGNVIYDNDGREMKRFEAEPGCSLHEEFVDAVASRNQKHQRAEIADGHTSATMCHMGNASYLCGETTSFEKARSVVAIHEQAERAFDQLVTHLSDNGVDTGRMPVVVGAPLTFVPETERFVDQASGRANLFLKGSYREPFVVPDQI